MIEGKFPDTDIEQPESATAVMSASDANEHEVLDLWLAADRPAIVLFHTSWSWTAVALELVLQRAALGKRTTVVLGGPRLAHTRIAHFPNDRWYRNLEIASGLVALNSRARLIRLLRGIEGAQWLPLRPKRLRLRRLAPKNADARSNIDWWPVIRGHLASLYNSDRPESNRRWRRDSQRGLQAATSAHKHVARLIEEFRPDALVIYNPRRIEEKAGAHAAEQSGIPVLVFELNRSGESFRLEQESLYAPKSIHRRVERGLQRLSVEERKSVVNSWVANQQNPIVNPFSSHSDSGKAISLAGSLPRPWAVLFTSSMHEYLSHAMHSQHIEQEDFNLSALRALLSSNWSVLVRAHPNSNDSEAQYLRKFLSNLELPLQSRIEIVSSGDASDSITLLRAADAAIVFESSLGLQALVSEKLPCIFGPHYFERGFSCGLNRQVESSDIQAMLGCAPNQGDQTLARNIIVGLSPSADILLKYVSYSQPFAFGIATTNGFYSLAPFGRLYGRIRFLARWVAPATRAAPSRRFYPKGVAR